MGRANIYDVVRRAGMYELLALLADGRYRAELEGARDGAYVFVVRGPEGVVLSLDWGDVTRLIDAALLALGTVGGRERLLVTETGRVALTVFAPPAEMKWRVSA